MKMSYSNQPLAFRIRPIAACVNVRPLKAATKRPQSTFHQYLTITVIVFEQIRWLYGVVARRKRVGSNCEYIRFGPRFALMLVAKCSLTSFTLSAIF